MKRLVLILFSVLPVMAIAQIQDDLSVFPVDENDTTTSDNPHLAKLEDLAGRIFFPLEFGINIPVKQGLDVGFTGKTSVEWRHHYLNGIFVTALYNVRDFSYKDILPDGSNLKSGDVYFHDIMLGAGWRWQFGKTPFCIAVQPFVGATIVAYTTISPDGDNYESIRRHSVVPSLRGNIFLEYYIIKSFAVYVSAAYVQHLQVTPFANSLKEDGCADVCIGINTALW